MFQVCLRKFSVAIMLIAGLNHSASMAAHRSSCGLGFSPQRTVISGTLVKQLFYGAPGYGEDKAHDEKLHLYVLKTKPVDVYSDKTSDLPKGNTTFRGIDEFQLNYADVPGLSYQQLGKFLGKRVVVAGTLLQAQTGGEHTNVIFLVSDFRLARKSEHQCQSRFESAHKNQEP